ncbi:MAG: MarR family winged helix-turn-helix transcriptional regulator [Sterolibacterium sp.]|jgi:DNA-binding MarR family transcriptional regulator
MKSPKDESPAASRTSVDGSFLQGFVGYNARRATLTIMEVFNRRMAALNLKPAEFSILSLIGRNPGVTPSQLCAELNLLPPKLAKVLARLDKRKLVGRKTLAADKRAVCLSLSSEGRKLLVEAESTVIELEAQVTAALTAKQRETLISLLKKIYS